MQWSLKSFDELTNLELYHLLKLRTEIFVVEQNCVYSDMDGKDTDLHALHLFAKESDDVLAYLRILPPDCSYQGMTAIGRVVTAHNARGKGIGHDLMERAINAVLDRWPEYPCQLSAQAHLQQFYGAHGFVSIGEEYLEDGIPHIAMRRTGR